MSRPISILTIFLILILRTWAAPIITEFSASNQTGIADEDGTQSDWIEIHNPDPTPLTLTGWYLSDTASNKTKWQFPSTTLAPNSYLIVFASNKNRRVAGQQLHTNFALSASGEYLGLSNLSGTPISEYSPTFPAQVTDISYGLPSTSISTVLVADNAPCTWLVPTSTSSPGNSWKSISYNPVGWNAGTMGIGYDLDTSDVDYLPFIGNDSNIETAMSAASQTSCYIRIPFNLASGTSFTNLKLRLRYDDGFAVWLNNQPVLSEGNHLKRNAPTSLLWNSIATASNASDSFSIIYQEFDITSEISRLTTGNNLLAFQSLNRSATSSDQLLQVELIGTGPAPSPSITAGYFATATPGAANLGPENLIVPQLVTFSRVSGTFTNSVSITLSGNAAGQLIRYTTDGTTPDTSSPIYSNALTISTSIALRARVYDSTATTPGFITAAYYERLASTLSNYNSSGLAFGSALPIIVLNNQGAGEIPDNNLALNTRIQIYDRTATGYSLLSTATAPTLTLNAGVKLRGRSSAGFPKKSYGIEIRNEAGEGKDTEILGMPANEDWALIGGWDFDRAFSRNAWIYEVSRQAGRWAPRTRLVEVYFNQDGDDLEFADYRGVYILCEAIRGGNDRVDIAKLKTTDTTSPDITGGYIFKVDSPESDEFSWVTTRNLPPSNDGARLVIHRPKLASLAPAQSTYLRNYFQQFENTLFTESANQFTTRQYRTFIDSEAWADHNLFSALAKNVDSLRLSAYFSKDRSDRIAAGPLWDFDRSVDSTDFRDDSPTVWRGLGDATDYHTYAWWGQLFKDIEFRQTYVDRWHALRKGSLATTNVNAILDGYLVEFKPADADNPARRDYARWYGSPNAENITTEINAMKTWIASRSTWIDGQFTALPNITLSSRVVTSGTTTSISIPSGTTVYYTIDGTDPRLPGGDVSPDAIIYTAPISISSTTRVIARAWRAGSFAIPSTKWSGPVEALYLINESFGTAAELRVIAVNYHPLAPTPAELTSIPGLIKSDFEWIELKNISTLPVNTLGISMLKDLPAAAVTLPAFTLSPNARVVIAKNAAAFELRYGSAAAARVVATWPGHPSLENAGERIILLDRAGSNLANFKYEEAGEWPTRADGAGSSIEYIGASASQTDYENPLSWKSSIAVHGLPGLGEIQRTGIVVNEILASRTDVPDSVELYNSSASAVNVSGWYLSDAVEVTSEMTYRQFRIPNGTVIQAGAYRVYDSANFNPTPLTSSPAAIVLDGARGGTLFLLSADPNSGKLLSFEQKEDYSPTLAGLSNGRFPNATGPTIPLDTVTLNAANTKARDGRVQVSEIHYHPAGATPEFLEVTNTTSVAEPLAFWTLRGDADFEFPVDFILAAGEAALIVPFNPLSTPATLASFRTQYNVPASTRVLGPWSDSLGDVAGTVTLRRRVPAPSSEPSLLTRMLEDEVKYLSTPPWPSGASGTGNSIQRLGIFRQGSDPTAWVSRAPLPGSASGYSAWYVLNFGLTDTGQNLLDPDHDGMPNLIEYSIGSAPLVFDSLPSAIEPNFGNPRIVLNYTLRLDRDESILVPEQSSNLNAWVPAVSDQLISSDGITEQRRASLPVNDKGFLRLKATRRVRTLP